MGSETGRAKRAERTGRIAGTVFGTVFGLFGLVVGVAVLLTGEGSARWFALLAAGFVAIGIFIVVSSQRGTRLPVQVPRSREAAESERVAGLPAGAREAAEVRVLKPAATPGTRLAGGIVFTLFWNGLVSVFVVQAVHGWRAGERPIFISLFLVPFVAIGLFAVGWVIHAFLALWNPRPRVRLTPGTLWLGERAVVEWDIEGAVHRLRKLTVTLEGREEATYRRGTNTRTDREVFARVRVAERDRGDLRHGSEGIALPEGTMHSFESSNNKIVWLLRVHGEIRLWPDIDEELPLVVLPREGARP